MKTFRTFLVAILVGMFVLALLIKRASAEILLTESNIVPIYGDIVPGMAESIGFLATELRAISSQKFYFVINSQGGRTSEADEIVKIINMFDNAEVIIVTAESAAAGISQLVNKKITIIPNGHLMFHHLSRTYSNCTFRVDEIVDAAVRFKKSETAYFAKVGKRIKYTRKDFMKKFKANTQWNIKAKEAKKLKAVDNIESISCSKSLSSIKTTIIEGGILMEKSLCPTKEIL